MLPLRAVTGMLRSVGKLAATPLRSIRRLRRRLVCRFDPRYCREREEFIRRARHLLPWLTVSRLTFLAYFAGTRYPKAHGRYGNTCYFEEPRYLRLPSLVRLGRLNYFRPEPPWIRRRVPKRNGRGTRTLYIPNVPLKHLQRFILRAYLDKLTPDQAAYGFQPGRSRAAHARHHCNKAVVVRLDIRDFFPTIPVGRITPVFQECGFARGFAETLAHLVTFRGRLPQGAPTSPRIADLVARSLDADLRYLARSRKWYYSRYADDLCFSSRRQRPRSAIESFVTEVEAVVVKHGFRLNHGKTRLMRTHRRQEVVGIVVNGRRPNVPRERRRLVRALLHRCERHGLLVESLRYREKLLEKGVAATIRPGRHEGEDIRSDRIWPYEKIAAYIPRRLRAAVEVHSDQEWTAVYDFWHYINGLVGELVSVDPARRPDLTARIRKLQLYAPASDASVIPSLEVREQRIVDSWRRLSDTVAEVNYAARRFTTELIRFRPPTPSIQRVVADSEDDFKLFIGDVHKRLYDGFDKRYRNRIKKEGKPRLPTLWAMTDLTNYFFHAEEERLTRKAHEAFRMLIGKRFPEKNEDWERTQVRIFEGLVEDLRELKAWSLQCGDH